MSGVVDIVADGSSRATIAYMIPPKVTTTQRNSLSNIGGVSTETGATIYNTILTNFKFIMVQPGTIASKSMTIKNSGTSLSFSEIESEFGTNPTRSLGSYRVSQNFGALTNQPLDAGIPSSGEISFNDFYSKQLNVIVDFYSGGLESRQVAKSRYNNGNVNVVGGFKSKPSNTSGTHVKIHVNKTISSENDGDQGVCALRTGNWTSGTTLSVDVGSSGKIAGAGGNGGRGANNEGENGANGQNGNSALGVEYTCIVNNSGTLVGGGGGGSGGGGGYDTDKHDDELGSGGGGAVEQVFHLVKEVMVVILGMLMVHLVMMVLKMRVVLEDLVVMLMMKV